MTFLVGICGGSGSGTSEFAANLQKELGSDIATLLRFDSYYCDLSHLSADARDKQNFHHPDLVDSYLLAQHLDALSAGMAVEVPTYDFQQRERTGSQLVTPTPVLLVEGSLLFAFTSICNRLDYMLFRDCPEPARLAALIQTNLQQHDDEKEIAAHFYRDIKPMHDLFVQPNRRKADFITHASSSSLELVMRLAHEISARSQTSDNQPAYSGLTVPS